MCMCVLCICIIMCVHACIEILYTCMYKVIDNCNIAYDIAIIHDYATSDILYINTENHIDMYHKRFITKHR